MWIAELVQKVITGHIRTPSAKARPGQRYARHARRRQTSVPTTASASRQRASRRNPVANNQWTCSLGGCMFLCEIAQQPRRDDEVEEQADRDGEERRLDEEPPDPLSQWVQQSDAVRLDDRPDDSAERRCRPERGDDPRAGTGGRSL